MTNAARTPLPVLPQDAGRYALRVTKPAEGFGGPPNHLNDWAAGVQIRLELQSEIAWAGLQDGYSQAGGVDPASPFAQLMWELDPTPSVVHCAECPQYAAGSPYDRPGSGGNELDATPGDGHTECGAACKCSLRYVFNRDLLQQVVNAWADAAEQIGLIDPDSWDEEDATFTPTPTGGGLGLTTPGEEQFPLNDPDLHDDPVRIANILRSNWQDALDRYRTAHDAWLDLQTAAPPNSAIEMVQLPDLIPSSHLVGESGPGESSLMTDAANLARLEEVWPQLSEEQQRLFVDAFGAVVDLAAALDQATVLGDPELLWDLGYVPLADEQQQLAEPRGGRWRLNTGEDEQRDEHGRWTYSGGRKHEGSHAAHKRQERQRQERAARETRERALQERITAHEGRIAQTERDIAETEVRAAHLRQQAKDAPSAEQSNILRARATEATRQQAQMRAELPKLQHELEAMRAELRGTSALPGPTPGGARVRWADMTPAQREAAQARNDAVRKARNDAANAARRAQQQAAAAQKAITVSYREQQGDGGAAERALMERKVGRPLTDAEAGGVVGARPGDRVEVHHGMIVATDLAGNVHTVLLQQASGDVSYTGVQEHGLVLHNFDSRNASGQSIPWDARRLQAQVQAATALGATAIVSKGRGGTMDHVQDLELGYNTPIKEAIHESRLNAHYQHTAHALTAPTTAWWNQVAAGNGTLQEAVLDPETAAWWRANGEHPHFVFDLAPGSPSRSRLATYLQNPPPIERFAPDGAPNG